MYFLDRGGGVRTHLTPLVWLRATVSTSKVTVKYVQNLITSRIYILTKLHEVTSVRISSLSVFARTDTHTDTQTDRQTDTHTNVIKIR